MRVFLGLGLAGLMFVFFALTAVGDGKLRDAAESGAAGIVLLAAAFFFGRRYVFRRAQKRARVSDLLARDKRD